MAKKVINANTLIGCPELYVIESQCKVGANEEGVVVIGGLDPDDVMGFEARKLSIRYAETKMGRKAGYNGEPVQKVMGKVNYEVEKGKVLSLFAARHPVTVTQ